MRDISFLRLDKLIFSMFTLSREIRPLSISYNLKRAETIEDLPVPDLPTIPTFSPYYTLKLKPFKTIYPLSSYFRYTF